MMNRDSGSSSAKLRRPRVKSSATNVKLDILAQPPLLARSNTLPPIHTNVRVRNSSLGLPDKEKARSDDGFHSDSDKDSNQSANSNTSVHSNKSYLTKAPSIKSSVVAKVRPKSSLGTMSDYSSSDKLKVELDIATLNRQYQADKEAEEAKKIRKIEDLEISIKTLTKFNSELEATNKRQAAEIQELKRKLTINDSLMSIYGSDNDEEVSTSLSETDLVEIGKDNETRFRQICMVIEDLIQNANDAIAYKSKIGGGSKVLTNAQLDSNSYEDESSKNLKGMRVSESSSEKIKIDTITNKRKSNSSLNSSVANEQIFVSDLKIKIATEKDNTNSMVQPSNLSLAEIVEEKDQRLQANLERARIVANELLSLEKQDNNVNNTLHNSERKGLGLLLPIQNGHSLHITSSSINGSDSSQPSPRMILLCELLESLGTDAESLKYLKDNRKSLPAMSSNKTNFIISPSVQKEGDSRSSLRSQTQSNKPHVYRRRSSPNFRTLSYPPMSKRITKHTTSSFIKKDDSVLNSLPHGSDVGKRSLWTYLF